MEFLKEFINIFFVLVLFYTLWLFISFLEEGKKFFKWKTGDKTIVYSLRIKNKEDYEEIMKLLEEVAKERFK